MSRIVPAIIPTSRHMLDVALASVRSFADFVQVDIVDGICAPSTSWPYSVDKSLESILTPLHFDAIHVELDLMIEAPEMTLPLWQQTGATHIVVHTESVRNFDTLFEHHKNNLYMLGLAFNNDSDISLLDDIHPHDYDFVQVMGIEHIGTQGQPFDERVVERIRELRSKYPHLHISVDGSVNETTLPTLVKNGASRFIVGSAILAAENPFAAYQKLETLVSRV